MKDCNDMTVDHVSVTPKTLQKTKDELRDHRIAAIRTHAAEGKTRAEIADILKMEPQNLRGFARRHLPDVVFVSGHTGQSSLPAPLSPLEQMIQDAQESNRAMRKAYFGNGTGDGV